MNAGRRERFAALRVVAAMGLAAAFGALAGCGDGSAERAKAAAAYASDVAKVTQDTGLKLSATSGGADYRDAASAADSTAQYAAAIRAAAGELAQAEPPASVAREHAELIALYRATADRLDALAEQFRGASGARELATIAQALSGEVQAYSTREAQLRGAIDRALATSVAPPAPEPDGETVPPATSAAPAAPDG